MDKLPPPKQFNIEGDNLLQQWKDWKRSFEIYAGAIGLDEKPQKRQTLYLLHCLGPECLKVYETFTFVVTPEIRDENDQITQRARNEGDEYAAVITKFDDYFKHKKKLRLIRQEFEKNVQAPGESVMTFVTRLKNKVKECQYGERCS